MCIWPGKNDILAISKDSLDSFNPLTPLNLESHYSLCCMFFKNLHNYDLYYL